MQPATAPKRPVALLLSLALCTACMHGGAAHAAGKKKNASHTSSSRTSGKSHSIKIQRQQNNSGETTAERERRLYRECRGLPNAGACRGYTHR